MKKYVAHMITEYLGHTLNWVYTQIKYVPEFSPYIMTSKVMNLESYPVDMIFKPDFSISPHFSWVDRLFRRLGYLPVAHEYCFSSALRKYPPMLIHAHFGWDGFFALGLKKKFKIPLITRFYGYDVGILPRIPLWRRRYKQLAAEGDLFIAEGKNMKSILEGIGFPSDKIVIHHLGIETEKILYVRRIPIPNCLRILMAATFKEKKGFEYALQAIAMAQKKLPGINIVVKIIGDGILKQKLHDLARELNIEKNIQWMGYQPHSEFIKSLYEADVFLSPSVTASDGDTEGGAPVAIIEAGASGLPVISTIHADIPEVVLDGQTGFLSPERNPDGLANAICELSINIEKRQNFGIKAHEHVQANYNAVIQGKYLTNIYSQFE
ncbi:MAG: colanic acid biosynthesis glycosyltransferase WcaL [Desulfobacteraceae bacterium]|nr:colanic acid biosynthesis glycosyltransferase WcaL [Desulfobacteraceae bacterium]